jgi:hypothetical protein
MLVVRLETVLVDDSRGVDVVVIVDVNGVDADWPAPSPRPTSSASEEAGSKTKAVLVADDGPVDVDVGFDEHHLVRDPHSIPR